jgi:hypothetical protein
MKKQTKPQLLSTKEAAKLLGYTEGSLATMRCTGSGPAFLKLGKIKYPMDELVKFMESRKRG